MPDDRTPLRRLLKEELDQLATVNPSHRPWQMPFAAALALGLPMFAGVYIGHMNIGMVASLGGLVFLYLPGTALHHRMVWLMACAFGMVACFALGLASHLLPGLDVAALTLIAIFATMACRFYGVGPPGSLFFVMAAAIAVYSPLSLPQLPARVGLIALGCLLACLIALLYSLFILRRCPPAPAPALQGDFDSVVVASVLIGLFVGLSLLLARSLQLERAYWVPVSCLAVIQGASLRAVWQRQLQRVLGTGVGLLLAWALLRLPFTPLGMALLITLLAFVIEILVVRHYGLAVVFITPLTIYLAEAATMGQGTPGELVQARLLDTVLGCLVGLAGGACLHSPRLRGNAERLLRRVLAQDG